MRLKLSHKYGLIVKREMRELKVENWVTNLSDSGGVVSLSGGERRVAGREGGSQFFRWARQMD